MLCPDCGKETGDIFSDGTPVGNICQNSEQGGCTTGPTCRPDPSTSYVPPVTLGKCEPGGDSRACEAGDCKGPSFTVTKCSELEKDKLDTCAENGHILKDKVFSDGSRVGNSCAVQDQSCRTMNTCVA